MTRVAAVDCGTNSVRLLVADVVDGRLTDVHRETRIVRLGQDVDRTGRLAPEALVRTGAALHDYGVLARELGAERTRLVATSATRDAANRDDFAALVRAELGVEPDVASGAEEARLSFTGAASVLPSDAGPLLVVDIGGGSTEVVRGDRPGDGRGELQAHSMDVGSVRMTERHLHDDPPTDEQVAAVVADVTSALDAARRDVPLDGPVTLVGVAGTVTTVTAVALGLERYDSARVHGAVLPARRVRETVDLLLRLDRDGRAALGPIHPGRLDVIAAGALVLRTVLDATGAPELVASEHDILDGIALDLG